MNAEHLLTHFDRLADAPNAILRLRRFILDLAVRGKLVEQDPEDEPAEELLKRIAAEKKRLVESGEIRKPKKTPLIDDSSLLFGAPHGWVWARLLDISRKIHYGFTASANQQIADVRLLRITDIQHNKVEWRSVPGCEIDEKTLPSFKLEMGDILIARTGGTIGKSFLVAEIPLIAVFASYLIRIQGSHEIYARYLKFFLESPVYWKQLQEGTRGAGQPNVNGQTLGTMLVPLPPLAEQHRIVTKVDELMALCDRLETARKEREATRDRLAKASLARLNAPDPDPAVFQNHAAFALNNLTPLTTCPDQIKALRQTILNLAVRGKLVEQDPEDEPAEELLKRIAAEKKRLVKMGKIRDAKLAIEALNEKFLHRLPLNWSVVTIAQIAYLRSGIALNHGEEQDIGDIPYLKVADLSLVENDKGILTSSRFVGRDRRDDVMESGSIVFPKRGGAIATNRKRRTHVNIVCDSNIMAMKPFVHDTLPFLELWFNSFDLWRLNSGTSVPQINNKDIYPLLVFLPPLTEQHRIVAKVDELMAVYDRLEASLAAGEETRGRLVEAVVGGVLGADTGREAT